MLGLRPYNIQIDVAQAVVEILAEHSRGSHLFLVIYVETVICPDIVHDEIEWTELVLTLEQIAELVGDLLVDIGYILIRFGTQKMINDRSSGFPLFLS